MVRYTFPLLLLLLQVFLFYRFRRWHRSLHKLPQPVFYSVVVLFVVFNAALIGVPFLRVFSFAYTDWFLQWVVYPFLFWHSSTAIIAIVLLIGTIVRLPFSAVWSALRKLPFTRERTAAIAVNPRVVQFDATRRQFLRRGVYGLTAVSLGGTAYGMIVGKNECDVSEQEIRIPGLPPSFNGFSIGLVTDVHSSIYMTKKDMDEYVRRLNDLGTDIIAVGGDMVNSSVDEAYPFAEAFSKLTAPMGIFGVLGNHDFYSGKVETVASMANQAGVRMLRDEGVLLRRNDEALHLVGIDDVATPVLAMKKLQQAVADVPKNIKRILLCHRPYFFKFAAARNVDLVLSGHTHGGQLVFGKFGKTSFTPAALASMYVAGHYKQGTAHMYVSRGIGTVAVPVRINCPPELTRIVLRPA